MVEPLTDTHTVRNVEELPSRSVPHFMAGRSEGREGKMLCVRPAFKPATKEGPESALLTPAPVPFALMSPATLTWSHGRIFWAPPAFKLPDMGVV